MEHTLANQHAPHDGGEPTSSSQFESATATASVSATNTKQDSTTNHLEAPIVDETSVTNTQTVTVDDSGQDATETDIAGDVKESASLPMTTGGKSHSLGSMLERPVKEFTTDGEKRLVQRPSKATQPTAPAPVADDGQILKDDFVLPPRAFLCERGTYLLTKAEAEKVRIALQGFGPGLLVLQKQADLRRLRQKTRPAFAAANNQDRFAIRKIPAQELQKEGPRPVRQKSFNRLFLPAVPLVPVVKARSAAKRKITKASKPKLDAPVFAGQRAKMLNSQLGTNPFETISAQPTSSAAADSAPDATETQRLQDFAQHDPLFQQSKPSSPDRRGEKKRKLADSKSQARDKKLKTDEMSSSNEEEIERDSIASEPDQEVERQLPRKKHTEPVFDSAVLAALTRVVDRLKDLNLTRLRDALEKDFDFCAFDSVKDVELFLREAIVRFYSKGSANQSNALRVLDEALRKEESFLKTPDQLHAELKNLETFWFRNRNLKHVFQ